MPAESPRLDAASLIEIWEATAGRHPIEGALATLDVANRRSPVASTDSMALGARDCELLRLRSEVLGDAIDAMAVCPACGTTVEANLSCAALVAAHHTASQRWEVRVGSYVVELAALTSADALIAAASSSAADARAVLLERAVRSAEDPTGPVLARDLPTRVVRAVVASLAEHDPAAEFLLDLVCPACAHHWTDLLDTAPFVVSELRRGAWHLLEEVDLLARTYGWSEGSILGLSPTRRAAYAALAVG